jgi:hypothetical protein
MTFAVTIYNWHFWQGAQFMASDEQEKKLYAFDNPDSCINFLYLSNEQEVARKLHNEVKRQLL